MNKFSFYLGASVVALTLAGPAFAEESADQLQKRVDDLEATVDALRSEIADIRKTPDFSKGAPNFQTTSGDYSFKVRGQIAVDAGVFNGRKGTVDYNDGTDIPRARLGVDGTFAKDWAYRLEADFSKASRDDTTTQSELDVKDAYVSYGGLGEKWKITVGQQKTPNTLERVNPSSDLLFVAVPTAVEAFTNRTTAGGDYKIGTAVAYTDVNWTATAGIYGENLGAQGGSTNTSKDEGWGPAARLTWAPINKNDEVLHLGVSGYYRTTGGRNSIRFRSPAEVTIDSNRLVDTGTLTGINSYSFEGLELAGVYGPLFFQSEYLTTQVDRKVGSSLNFDGAYAEVAYALTGESRPYKAGAFSRLKPSKPFDLNSGGWGAWELAGRYSTIDLTDGAFKGGKENNWSFGVNWYPNSFVRVLADYVRYDAKDSLASPPVAGSFTNAGDAFITEVSVIW
ncbi:MAG: porin [Parvibaculum sp.]|jgi:phosphate-selective porin OprO/OprP|uniref:OprO/OprP family phosphate-selective porin n=1 Tax=Parvibaculum sp. TaxID=2024848 RepID=UPI0028412110|nr:porin [Parvibaculum sp.]MDR3500261.1 porin [Parvibaculum sp.]